MKIVSTNISKVKKIFHNNKEIKTGIFKSPTTNEVVITKTNIIGDQQADLINHGGEHKAVYAFSSAHYEFWIKELKNENISFGMFGENFTISNLSEKDICIGDQFRVGTALLEVSQTRYSWLAHFKQCSANQEYLVSNLVSLSIIKVS